ncbi:hypothetical protein LZ31DRAFT_432410, partial [Colletotrichum somersetense]
MLSLKCLALIRKQYRLAKKAIPSSKRLFLAPIREYSLDYTVLTKLSILYYYKIFIKI